MAAGVVGLARAVAVAVLGVRLVRAVVRVLAPARLAVPQAAPADVLAVPEPVALPVVVVVEVAGLHVVHGVPVVVITGARVRGQVNCLVGAVHDIATSTA